MTGERPGEVPFDLVDTATMRHDIESEIPFTNTIVKAIAAATDSSAFEITPLHESINPDALNTILATARTAADAADAANLGVVFSHRDCAIGVSSDGRIGISDQFDGARTDVEDILAINFSTDVHTVRHDWDSNRSLAATVVRTIASVTGLEPRIVHDRLDAVVDLHAVNALFQPRGDGTARPPGGIQFSFQAYEVAVLADGKVALQSTLTRLKQTGGNLLLVGAVPDDVLTTVSAPLLGTATRSRIPLFALHKTSVDTARERLSESGASQTDARIITHRARTRSPTAVLHRPSDFHVTAISGGLDDLRGAITDTIAEIDQEQDGLAPAELRFSFDSLESVLHEHDRTAVVAFLEAVCDAVSQVAGMGHYVLQQDRSADPVSALEPLFDAVIELRVTSDGPEQRWSFRTTGYTTAWFPLTQA